MNKLQCNATNNALEAINPKAIFDILMVLVLTTRQQHALPTFLSQQQLISSHFSPFNEFKRTSLSEFFTSLLDL